MSLQHHLRQRKISQTALEKLRNCVAGSEIVQVNSENRYLQLRLYDEYGTEREAFLDIDAWLQAMGNELPGIPWQQVPLSYLSRWLKNFQLNFLLGENIWDVNDISLPKGPLPSELLSLPSQPSSLFCTDWPELIDDSLHQATSHYQRVPFVLRYVLGHSKLPLLDLAELAVGDLLLIKDECRYLAIGEHKLFRYLLQKNQEILVEEKFNELSEHYLEEEEALLEWSSLPVDIEFVFDSNTITLAELDDIKPGATLSVNPGAEQRIKIYLNKKLFARGELVALDNGTLAVEVNHIIPAVISQTVDSDV